MDHATETVVTARLKELNEKGTTLVISTHRHSLTDILERLVVIDQGKKIMDGGKQEVLQRLSRSVK
jgi:ATP-binding cassette subfamily C protein LapB